MLLVSCYELGHQPFATALAAGFLERDGFAPAQLDLAKQALDPVAVRQARLVAISVPMHTALRLGVRAADQVRALNSRATICLFGLYAWLNRDHLLGRHADVVLAGEGEAALVRLAQGLDRGESASAPTGPILERLSFPLPSRAALPDVTTYAHLQHGSRTTPAAYVEGSRGCLHLCRHCPIPPVYGGRFFVLPVDLVIEDIRRQVTAGAGHVTFGDPDFLNGPGHALRLVRAHHAAFPDVTFDFTAKVEHLLRHRALLPELVAQGALFVVSAVESLSDVVLSHLEKRHTRADVVEVLRITREAGLTLRPSLVAFTPWTTIDDYVDLVQFILDQGLTEQVDPIQFAIRLLIPPGSALLSIPAMQAHLGALDAPGFSYRWTHPDPRMDTLYRTVSGLVEAGAARQDPAGTIIERVYEAACTARGGPAGQRGPAPALLGEVPRLSEPWFCCAEPATEQLLSLGKGGGARLQAAGPGH